MIATLRAFMTKEIRHILRDRQTLTILLLMPLVQVVLFGYALRSDVHDVRLAVVDPSPDYATLALRDRFAAGRRFKIVAVEHSMNRIEPLFHRGSADVAVELDPDFADAHYNLARLFEQQRKPQHAIRHYANYRRLTKT